MAVNSSYRTRRMLVVLSVLVVVGLAFGLRQPSAEDGAARAQAAGEAQAVDRSNEAKPGGAIAPDRSGKTDLPVPAGSPDELVKFLHDLNEVEPQGVDSRAKQAHAKRVCWAAVIASDKILASHEASDDALTTAVSAKFTYLEVLAELKDPDAAEDLRAFRRAIQQDRRPAIVGEMRYRDLVAQLRGLDPEKSPTLNEAAKLIGDYLRTASLRTRDVTLALALPQALEQMGRNDRAAHYFELFGSILAASSNPEVSQAAKLFEGASRRLNLVGKPIEIEGTRLDGKPFDWKDFKGKVVLVDFWATWCPACIQEMPNIEAKYRKYHDRGFEVVSVNLDKERKTLEEFLAKKPLPWPILYDGNPRDEDLDHPLAIRYGIFGLPSMLLVDQSGKVVSLEARGRELGDWLEKLLGPGTE